MKTNIALIGFMGSGKTAVGQALAKKLGWQLIEIDSIIERKTGRSISDIFQQDGEIYFRELEIEAIKNIASGLKQVIGCGGGAVLNTINIDRLKKTSVIVNLASSPGIIMKRTSQDHGSRPLLNVQQPTERIKELMKLRKPFYDNAADITINTSKMNIDAAVDTIINRLKNYEGFNFQE